MTPKVCYLLPSANERLARVYLPQWLAAGYRVVTLQDRFKFDIPGVEVHRPFSQFLGYPASIRWLVENALPDDCDLVVTGGDDMAPDPNLKPATIREQFFGRFPDGYGVMQPTGDRWGTDKSGRSAAERICGSPFMGREFLLNSYEGLGPFFRGYFHFYADEELFNVATRDGVLWQRRDMTHFHDHWTRTNRRQPEIYGLLQAHWERDRDLFAKRRSQGFPDSGRLRKVADE